ncbi:hypothetical protein ACH3XW_1875 [Acanthocheilonema viteae]
MNMARSSIHEDCVEYAKNHTICTTLKACKATKCTSRDCESIPAVHFHNVAVILNKRLRNKSNLKEQLNPLLHDPLQTSIFTQRNEGAYCGQEKKLLRDVKIKVMISEGIFQQLLRKASFLQERYLYARNDCLNKCHMLGINLKCQLVPDNDMEVIKTAAFKHLQHMIFYQCGEFPMLAIITAILILILMIITILELALGISRIRAAKKRSEREDSDEMTIKTLSTSIEKSKVENESGSNESTDLEESEI